MDDKKEQQSTTVEGIKAVVSLQKALEEAAQLETLETLLEKSDVICELEARIQKLEVLSDLLLKELKMSSGTSKTVLND